MAEEYATKLAQAQDLDDRSAGMVQALTCNFAKFLASLSNFASNQNQSIVTQMGLEFIDDDGRALAPGMTGTQKSALFFFSSTFDILFEQFYELSNEMKKVFDRTTGQVVSTHRTESSKLQSDALNAASKIKNVIQMVQLASGQPEHANIMKRISSQIAEFGTKTLIAAYRVSKSTTLYKDIIKERKLVEPQRNRFIDLGVNAHNSFIESIIGIGKICEARRAQIGFALDQLPTVYSAFTKKVGETVKQMEEIIHEIDFQSDFRSFVQEQKLVRYDIPSLEFIPLDLSSPAFKDIDTKIAIPVFPIYPIALAQVIESFTSSGNNQLSCTRGKYILLMEQPDQDWCFAQNPDSMQTGYLPSWAIRKVGIMLGVIVKEAEGLNATIGSYCSIESRIDANSYQILTVRGERGVLPSDSIGIIYSD